MILRCVCIFWLCKINTGKNFFGYASPSPPPPSSNPNSIPAQDTSKVLTFS